MPITDQILDQLLADCKSPEDLMGEQGLLRQLTKKLAAYFGMIWPAISA